MVMKSKRKGMSRVGVIEILACVFFFSSAFADNRINEFLWPNGNPDSSIAHSREEIAVNRDSEQNEFGFNRSISYVSIPGLTVYPAPEDKSTGAAIIIFPGGGFTHLAIDKEGHDVARWLNTIGITGIVVKYRTRPEGLVGQDGGMPESVWEAIVSDGLRAVRIVRHKAVEWDIDPNRIGVMGFSAGGRLAVTVATRYDQGKNSSTDRIERVGSRPDFACLVYPSVPKDIESLVSGETPPMFIVNAGDDRVTPAEKSVRLYQALLEAEIPAELHIYTKGGHGFGLGVRGGAVRSWPGRFAGWLGEMDLLSVER
jgi:acetyl esterase/lipase